SSSTRAPDGRRKRWISSTSLWYVLFRRLQRASVAAKRSKYAAISRYSGTASVCACAEPPPPARFVAIGCRSVASLGDRTIIQGTYNPARDDQRRGGRRRAGSRPPSSRRRERRRRRAFAARGTRARSRRTGVRVG